jgi:hypothetical protein
LPDCPTVAEGVAIYTTTVAIKISAAAAIAWEARSVSEQLPSEKRGIELGTHQYSWRDRRSGKRVRDFSPGWARNWMLVTLLMLGFLFWHRTEGSRDLSFECAALCSFCVGAFAFNWLKSPWAWLGDLPRKWATIGFIVVALLLVSVWGTRGDQTPDMLFWSTSAFAFLAGVFAGRWFRDIY